MTGGLQSIQSGGVTTRDRVAFLVRWELLALAAVTILTLFFRLWHLDTIPPGLHYDEAGEALDAMRNLEKAPQVFSSVQGGREGLFAGLVAVFFALFGPSTLVLRTVAAVSGSLAVPATYLTLRSVLDTFETPADRARHVALLGALGLATAYWQVHLTRLGLRHSLFPLLAALANYFLWRGFRRSRWPDFAWAGVFLGLSLYTYLSARFLPILWLVFLVVQALVVLFKGGRMSQGSTHWSVFKKRPPAEVIFLQRFFKPLLLAAAVSVLVILPLGLYYLSHPDDFLGRAGEVSIFNSELTGGNLWGALGNSLAGNFGAVAANGDPDPLVNLPGRPFMNWWLVPFFGLGLLVALRHLANPAYLFLVLWLFVLWLPALLTYDVVPRFMRAYGIGPALYGLLGLGVVAAAEWLAKLRARLGPISLLALAIILFLPTAVSTFRGYFLDWAPSDAAYEKLYQPYVEIGREIDTDPVAQETLYVFPSDLRINYHNRQRYILNFLFVEDFGYERNSKDIRYTFVQIDENEMFGQLTDRARGKSLVHLFDLKRGLQQEADPKQVLPFLLEKYGTFLYSRSFRDYDLHTYRLNSSQTTFAAAEDWRPVEKTLAEGLTLLAFGAGAATDPPPETGSGPAASSGAIHVPAGQPVWFVLRWQTAHATQEDFKTTVRLVDAEGQVVIQQDHFILSRYHLRLSGWHPGEQNLDFYLLDVPPGTPPGEYRLTARVYSPTNLQLQADALDLTPVTVEPPLDFEAEVKP